MIILFIVLFFGIKVKLGLNTNSHCLVINMILFNRFYILNINMHLIKDKFYYYINNGSLHELAIKKYGKYKGKLNIKSLRLRLYDGNINIALNMENMAHLYMIGGVINMIFAYLKCSNKYEFNHLDTKLSLINSEFSLNMSVEFIIRFSIIKILFRILHTIIKDKLSRRHYETKSNRRVDGVNIR